MQKESNSLPVENHVSGGGDMLVFTEAGSI